MDGDSLLRLDPCSLKWRRLRARNRPCSHLVTPAACLAGGVLIGGVSMRALGGGIAPVPKLDLLALCEPPTANAEAGADPSGASAEKDGGTVAASWEGCPRSAAEAAEAENDADEGAMPPLMRTVQITLGNGLVHEVQFPAELVDHLDMLQQAYDEESSDADNLDSDGEEDSDGVEDSD